ncbi:polymerase nucleotidyl transferase domain [Arabidopsis thaliana x Arabidopsis arenosa]|uniref:Polymerase nucleotidyl transferase domain n=1 Tax=Arabidopsis thaliana x Arabidopsis arenosa TaxID=1240361 RepID=A0A8T1ZNS7_9BRAS|nr:polymerase nucleotidyl transferase domain [Arabidopsis thaliana x Arabidopsis arenosa]KAG7561077.1 polymerase nucleotidyl transferase domain [Arabidopsis thaliana x Arabidopsis arenosa]
MGDIQERLSVSSSSSSSSSSLSLSTSQPKADSLLIEEESWMIAEERAHEILCTIQPALVSDKSRNEIIDYVRTLIKSHDGIEVFSFGSVPLKTYLPDGDIDLTVLTKQNMDDDFYGQLCNRLQNEERESEFHATDVQFIPAQVKVIKCNIRNIAVDISFNQTAGLCALCFLEQVDQLFGRDHLFKRSIILVKAWCYYESRILGANTGLISTYALAVLVLYIINLFHSSLSGPLAVLYKFLDYYGSFDWNNYCVSVNGPVPISSLPELTASPENGHELLLDEKFLRNCVELYSAPTKAVDSNGLEFPIKHLNIVDPLKYSNNLGKSVTQGNVQRIRHAFILGARKLRDVLSLPGATMGWRLERFFRNSLERNGKGQRQDVYDPVTAFGTGRSELSELSGDFEGYFGRLVYGQIHGYSLPGTFQHGYIPVSSQVTDPSGWDIVRHLVTYRKNEFYLKSLNVSTSTQPFPLHSLPNGCQNMRRGTGTYIPDMSQQVYSDRFRDSDTGTSSTHHLEASAEAIDNDGASSCCNLSGEVSTCTGNKGEECVRPETNSNPDQKPLLKSQRSKHLEIDDNCQFPPPENPVEPLSSSTLVLENGKEENSRSSQTMNGS